MHGKYRGLYGLSGKLVPDLVHADLQKHSQVRYTHGMLTAPGLVNVLQLMVWLTQIKRGAAGRGASSLAPVFQITLRSNAGATKKC